MLMTQVAAEGENSVTGKTSAREIGVAVEVLSLGDIQTAQQSFEATLILAFEWFPTDEEVAEFKENPKEWQPAWSPRFVLANAVSNDMNVQMNKAGRAYSMLKNGTKDNFERLISLPDGHEYIITVRYNIVATFIEELNLRNFPFDCQDIKIVLRSTQPVETAIFVPHFRRAKFFKLSTKYITLSDWYLQPSKVTFRLSGVTDSMFTENFRYSVVASSIMLQRNPNYYLQRVVGLLFIITGCTALCFCLDPVEEASDRLGLLFTLLLTAVAFMFIITADLPKVSYMTLMDKYIISCFLVITGAAFEATLAKACELSLTAELPVMFAMLAAFVVLQVGWVLVFRRAKHWEWETKMMPVYGHELVPSVKKGKAHLIGVQDMAATGEIEQDRTNTTWKDLLLQGKTVSFVSGRH